MDADRWDGTRVFVTGHTGFKGAWLCTLLAQMGAEVYGYAFDPRPGDLFGRAGVADRIAADDRGDIRDRAALMAALRRSDAEVVLHLAAQTVVRECYDDPREAFSTNVMGTFEVLDCLRSLDTPMRCVVVTTDKVYRNREWWWGYRETDALGGDDPYSASKSGTEVVTHAMSTSFPRDGLYIATARAGNVVGGGDNTPEALIPEVVASLERGSLPVLRYPTAVRPWQHVLEPLSGYLTLAERLDGALGERAWNFGPSTEDVLSVADVASVLARAWGEEPGFSTTEPDVHETHRLLLDSSLARNELGWRPMLDSFQALQWTADWESSVRRSGRSPADATAEQVGEYLRLTAESHR